jgi:FkbM family methyltransferase
MAVISRAATATSAGRFRVIRCILLIVFAAVLLVLYASQSEDVSYSLLDGSVDFGLPFDTVQKISNFMKTTASDVSNVSTTTTSSSAPLPGLQPIRCEQFLEDIYRGVINISDPNGSRVFGRRIDGNSGHPFWVSVHEQEFDKVRWETIFVEGQYYERAMDQAFFNVLTRSSPEAIVVDVGGNIGWFTLFARSMGFSVETFEPLQKNAARLCESLRLNRWSNALEKTYDTLSPERRYVNVHGFALGEADTEKTFHFHPTNPGEGSLHAQSSGIETLWTVHQGQRSETIQVATLKIDIEGYEPLVFAGGNQMLRSKMIKNILLELSPNKPEHNEAANIDMLNSIINAGYSLHRWGKWQGPNQRNPFLDSPLNKLAELLVDKTMKMGSPQQINLWFKLVE